MSLLMNCSKIVKFFLFLSFWYMYHLQHYFFCLIWKDCMIFFYSKACLTIWYFVVSLTKTIWIVFFWFLKFFFYLNYQAVWMVFYKLLRWHLLWFSVRRVQADQFFVEQFCLFLQLYDWFNSPVACFGATACLIYNVSSSVGKVVPIEKPSCLTTRCSPFFFGSIFSSTSTSFSVDNYLGVSASRFSFLPPHSVFWYCLTRL